MRRLSRSVSAAAALAAAALLLSMPAAPAWAEPTPDDEGASTRSGPSRQATAEILSGEPVVTARESSLVSGGGGGSAAGTITCAWYLGVSMGAARSGARIDPYSPPAELVGQTVWLARVCRDGAGNYVDSREMMAALPFQPGAEPVDPRELALMARQRLPIPEPRVVTSPPLDHQQIVNLPTWLAVEEWAPVSRSAAAGGVTATATARPVSHRWTFGPGEWEDCSGPGARYDYSKPGWAQSTDCSHTFLHSSTLQPDGVHHVQVTITWEVTWTSNIGAGGALGPVSRATAVDMVVGEIQAVNTSGQGR